MSHDAARCPTCKRASTRAAAGKVFPFCSTRCWAIDLGKWLGEEYRVASIDHSGDEQQAPGSGDDHEP